MMTCSACTPASAPHPPDASARHTRHSPRHARSGRCRRPAHCPRRQLLQPRQCCTDVQAVGMVGHHMRQFAVNWPPGHVVDDLRAMFERGQRTEARGVDGQHRPFGESARPQRPARSFSSASLTRFSSRTGGFRSMSMMSAPAFIIASPWALAASGASQRPPSEKESSVMLSTPITNVRWLS